MNDAKLKVVIRIAAMLLAVQLCSTVQAGVIAPELEAELAARAPNEEVSVILSLSDKVNHRLFEVRDRKHRDGRLTKALKDKAAVSQATHKTFLLNRGGRKLRELWSINGIAVKVRAEVVRELATRRGIESIRLDSTLQAPPVTSGTTAIPEWNLNALHAPDLWALGFTGTGVVVAGMDTGVDPNHPDLSAKWRGGTDSWFDPHGEHATPYDPTGHGTQTMGIMVGGSGGGTAIGVAPDARWIATKIYNDAGQASYSDIHLAFQWLLDPDGNPNTLDSPDVVNASWGLVGTAGQCITEFSQNIDILKAAGIAVVFAAGNDGPAPLTSLSPANNASGFSTGAVDSTLAVASFSSRGQSACDGTVYPKMAAPGVNVNTTDLSFGGMPLYTVVSGTSYASPHTAGVIALLENAFPQATVAELEGALTQSAQDLGVAGSDNSYGYGLTNALAAYQNLLAVAGSMPSITSTPVTSVMANSPYGYAVVASDPAGNAMSYALDVAPAGMTINAASGVASWTPSTAQAGANAVTVRATSTQGKSVTQSFTVTVALPVNHAPVANSNAYTMIKGGTLTVSAPGVLANDNDQDAGDTLSAVNFNKGTASGTLTGSASGGFSYKPASTFSGTAMLSYQAQDNNGAFSNAATITITVTANRAPLLSDDMASALLRIAGISYPAVIINVLANDSDPDTAIDPNNRINPATVFVSKVPDKGGRATANPDGTISYVPMAGFSGTETFRYKVKDTLGLAPVSAAYVRVTVK